MYTFLEIYYSKFLNVFYTSVTDIRIEVQFRFNDIINQVIVCRNSMIN